MSKFYETVIVPRPAAVAEKLIDTKGLDNKWRAVSINASASAVMSKDISRVFDEDLIFEFAKRLSCPALRVLAIFYDDGYGIRSAYLFNSGELTLEFSEQDELWAPTDQKGVVIPSADPIRKSQRDENVEYQTVKDAVQLGLEELALEEPITSEELREIICYSD